MPAVEIRDMAHMRKIFGNEGYCEAHGRKLEFADVLATTNAREFLPQTIVTVIKEAQEPLMVLTGLLDQMAYKFGQTVVMPAIGAMTAADIAEGQDYPEVQPQIGGATVTAQIGKSGLAFGFTEEMMRYSNWPLMNIYMREAGRALIRWKEVKIAQHILALGIPIFDNLYPTTSIKGVLHGRGLTGAANGSMTMDDLFDMYAQLLVNGYVPNALLVHPLTWLMWVKDPVMRQFALAAGGGTFFYGWQGQVNKLTPWSNGPQGKAGMDMGQKIIPGDTVSGDTPTPLTGYNQTMTGAPVPPRYFGFPLTIHVSPFMPYDVENKLTDVVMFAQGELGALLIDEPLTTKEWEDPRADIRRIKLRERYCTTVYNEGNAIAIARNVKVVPNEIVLPAQPTISVSGSIGEIPPTTPVV